MPELTIVVLNYNGREDTLACLRSLSHVDAKLILVDNGSHDGTAEAVKSGFPTVEVLQTGANLGYAGGMNTGLRHALQAESPYICVLNNDTVALPDTFDFLLQDCRAEPDRAVSPRIDYADGSGVWFAGAMLDRREGWPNHLGPTDQVLTEARSSELLTGCCMVASAETWRKVGLFDEDLFLNFEDSDWSMRASAMGVDLRVVPDAVLLHGVSNTFRSSPAISLLGTYYFLRNALVFQRRYAVNWSARLRFLRVHVGVATRQDLRARRIAPPITRMLALLDFALGRAGAAGKPMTWVSTLSGTRTGKR